MTTPTVSPDQIPLAAAHGKGIVHRDLRPGNLFLSRDDRAKILGFAAVATAAGLVMMGWIGYMRPSRSAG